MHRPKSFQLRRNFPQRFHGHSTRLKPPARSIIRLPLVQHIRPTFTAKVCIVSVLAILGRRTGASQWPALPTEVKSQFVWEITKILHHISSRTDSDKEKRYPTNLPVNISKIFGLCSLRTANSISFACRLAFSRSAHANSIRTFQCQILSTVVMFTANCEVNYETDFDPFKLRKLFGTFSRNPYVLTNSIVLAGFFGPLKPLVEMWFEMERFLNLPLAGPRRVPGYS